MSIAIQAAIDIGVGTVAASVAGEMSGHRGRIGGRRNWVTSSPAGDDWRLEAIRERSKDTYFGSEARSRRP